jgi:hypothetical protein
MPHAGHARNSERMAKNMAAADTERRPSMLDSTSSQHPHSSSAQITAFTATRVVFESFTLPTQARECVPLCVIKYA